MAERTGVVVSRDRDALRVSMPAARNPWFAVAAVVFGAPWLVTVVAGAVIGARQIPDQRVALVWVFVAIAVLALTGLLDLLAVATIWLALYSAIGRETLEITSERALLRRVAGPVGVPIKLGRGPLDRVTRIDPVTTLGRVPHPTIEVDFNNTRARFGAGISAWDADRLVHTISAFIAETCPEVD